MIAAFVSVLGVGTVMATTASAQTPRERRLQLEQAQRRDPSPPRIADAPPLEDPLERPRPAPAPPANPHRREVEDVPAHIPSPREAAPPVPRRPEERPRS